MSTKKESKTTATFNPAAMSTYNAFQPQVQTNLTADMQTDFTKSPTYQLALQKSLQNADQLGQRNINAFLSQMADRGFENNTAGLDRVTRQNSALQANAFLGNILAYDAMRRNAVAQAQGYRPLQTGQESVEKTSGLGTWLPNVVGAGLGLATGFMGGGAASAFGAMSPGQISGAFGGPTQAATSIMPMAGTAAPTPYNPSYWTQQWRGGN